MAARRITIEYAARLGVIGIVLGLPLGAWLMGALRSIQPIVELHARVAEAGGWTPIHLTIPAGQSLYLRLTSDDVMHGFAIGQLDRPALDVWPGRVVETTLTFERPGTYVFYCTRWCGLGHWRMRGTIEVTGEAAHTASQTVAAPLYAILGLDLDAPHPIARPPASKPSAARGAQLGLALPADQADYRTHSPAQVWQSLRARAGTLGDIDVWDVVAFQWKSNTTPQTLAEGQQLYAANCAACHGEQGAGDGIAASLLANKEGAALTEVGHALQAPTDFTDPSLMLGASPALLQGKIIRGGMGTGMPYWGPIFTEAQTWALVDYLWTFQFDYQEVP